MKLHRTLTVAILSVASLAGCGEKQTGGDVLTLDLAVALRNRQTFDLADISRSVALVPLDDADPNSLVGSIGSITESENAWYLRETAMGSFDGAIKLFDRSGKFIATRGVLGRGPDEFTNLYNIAADWGRDVLYVSGTGGDGQRLILAYDASGKIIARGEPELPAVAAATFVDGELTLMAGRSWKYEPRPDGKRVLVSSLPSDLKSREEIFVSDKGSDNGFVENPQWGRVSVVVSGDFMSNNGQTVAVKEILCDTVLYLKDRALTPAYISYLGDFAPPAAAFGEDATEPWRDEFRTVGNMWEGDRYLIAEIASLGAGSNEVLVLDRGEPAAVGLSAIGPGGDNGLFLGGVRLTPCYIRDNRLVGYMQAIDIVDNADRITNPDLKAVAATLKEGSNPVMIVATLKK